MMANYRQIHVSIWKDCWFLDLEPKEKLLFIYLFSNSETNMAGIYKISFKVICFETNLPGEFVGNALENFEKAGKIMYKDGVMWIKNMQRYHSSKSPRVQTGIQSDLDNIPRCDVKIQYLYSINTGTQQEQEQEEEQKQEINKEEEQKQNDCGRIYQLFENEISMLTPAVRDMVNDWLDTYSVEWIEDAIQEAVSNNARKPNYINAILENWKRDGRNAGKRGKGDRSSDKARSKYAEGWK